ncbi:hypothetical protein [Raoultella terrigena]|uniref:hypothetical protein n=1 Tax=Raoultella terrigena TaxID=577 RepID=UPI001269CED1|nr:hypothetical protein [Raoultella terrigena]
MTSNPLVDDKFPELPGMLKRRPAHLCRFAQEVAGQKMAAAPDKQSNGCRRVIIRPGCKKEVSNQEYQPGTQDPDGRRQ